jgi:lipid-binding SYLF domain-containing protein
MKPVLFLSFMFTLAMTLGSTVASASSMQDDVNQAVSIIERFTAIPETSIPREVLRDAKGLAILTVIKAGFIVSGSGGEGIVVARTARGWSGPSAIGTGSLGFGFQIGGQVTEFVIVLNTYDAVRAFSRGANVKLGADVSVAAGPVGREVAAGIMPMAAVYTYSRSQGLFAGVALSGTVIVTRGQANTDYYGRPVTPRQILSGKVKPPAGAKRLIQVLSKY